MPIDLQALAQSFDHTNLKATATRAEIGDLCEEAKTHSFFGVCCEPRYVAFAKECLTGSSVKVVSVVGFPLGATFAKAKAYEAELALAAGADEIDWVLDQPAVANWDEKALVEDIACLAASCRHVTKKLIFETCYMTSQQISQIASMAAEARIEYLKTSTGFGSRGASLQDLEAMAAGLVGASFEPQIKASGGIRNLSDALAFIKAGATRLGASASVAIMREFQST